MINRYAFDPEVVEDPFSFALLVRDLGIENGRVLSDDFPEQWIQRAKDAIRRMSAGRERQRAEEHLKLLSQDGSKRLRSNLPFNAADTWATNARRSHSEFRAAVCGNSHPPSLESPANFARAIAITSPNHPLWQVARDVRFPATVPETMKVLLPLVAGARRAIVMEPFLDPTRPGHRDLAKEIIQSVRPGGRVDFHGSYLDREVAKNRPGATASFPSNEWESAWNSLLRDTANRCEVLVSVDRWIPRAGVTRLHRRGVVIDRGGIRLDRALHIKTGDYNEAYLMGREWSRDVYREFTRKDAESFAQYDYKRYDHVLIAPD